MNNGSRFFSLGTAVKAARKNANLTQDQLAEKMGICPKHLSAIETGRKFTSQETLKKFSEFLDLSSIIPDFYDKAQIFVLTSIITFRNDSQLEMIEKEIKRLIDSINKG